MSEYKKITNKLLKEIEKNKFHPLNVGFDDGYFIFERGEDSVVKFHIKECKGWLFGIWWSKDEELNCLKYDFFAQYENCIDKFKPAASVLNMETSLYDKRNIKREALRMLGLIKYIKKFPYRAWCHDVYYGYEIWNEVSDFEAWRKFMKYRVTEFVSGELNKIFDKKCEKILERVAEEALIGGKVNDLSEKGFVCFPRFWLHGKNFKKNKVSKKGCYSIEKYDLSPKLRKDLEKYNKWHERLKKYISSDYLDYLDVVLTGE